MKTDKPMSDLKLLELIEKNLVLKMVRRTITKYRQQFNIKLALERKTLHTKRLMPLAHGSAS